MFHAYRAEGRTDHPAFPPGCVDVFKVPKIPRAFGEAPLRAAWGERLMLRVSRKLWRGWALGEAIHAWNNAARDVRLAAKRVPRVMDEARDRRSSERANMLRALGEIHEDLQAISDSFETLARSCSTYVEAAKATSQPQAERIVRDAIALADSTRPPIGMITDRLPRLLHDRSCLFMVEPISDLPDLSLACDWLNEPGPDEEDEEVP